MEYTTEELKRLTSILGEYQLVDWAQRKYGFTDEDIERARELFWEWMEELYAEENAHG